MPVVSIMLAFALVLNCMNTTHSKHMFLHEKVKQSHTYITKN